MSIIDKLGISKDWTFDNAGIGEDSLESKLIEVGYDREIYIKKPDRWLIEVAPKMLELLIDLYDDWKNIDFRDPQDIMDIIQQATGMKWEEICKLNKS